MLIWAVAAGAACIVIWMMANSKAGPPSATSERAAEPATPIPAERLLLALDTYPGPGSGPYVGNHLSVSGVVSDPDQVGGPEVWIHRREDGAGVLCTFTEGALDPAEPLRHGERVVVYGRCERYEEATGVRMTRCELVDRQYGDEGAMGAP